MATSLKKRSNDPELDILRIELIRQQVDRVKLCQRLGISRATFTNIVAGNNRSRRPRLELERILGVEIFSDLEPYRNRRNRKPATNKNAVLNKPIHV